MSSITRAGYNSNTCITWDFNFTYDGFGNTTSIKVGSSIYTTEDDRRVLAEYEYADKDGLLTKQTYGNGDYTSFTYDNLGRKKETKTSSGDTYNYKYTGDGQLYSITDVAGGLAYQYTYDTLGRLMQATRTSTKTANHAQSLQASYTYDTDNRIKKLAYNIPGVDNTFASYYYSSDESSTDVAVGALTKMSMFSKGWINYTYDAQGRLFTRNIADLLNESYAYLTNPNNNTRTTTWISGKTIVAPNGTSLKNFSYEYNNLGYIKTERESWSGIELEYDYDKQGQLLSAKKSVNDTLQKTYTYTYDTYGNIRTATDGTTSHTYTYGDSDWADLLTAYDGTALTYDASGNPTSYYNGANYTMQWRNGRELQNLTKGGKKTSYEYDVDGLRNLKTNADGSYSVYYWLGNLLLAEERHTGNSTRVLVFSYDENNSPIGFQFKTNDGPWYYYLYAKNIQGDIVALYRRDINADGTRSATHIANYEYDPWGKLLSIKNAAGQDVSAYPDNSANINPLRYRGYYYDNESGFYYLQSRYYDPSIGRFINTDSYVSTGTGFLGYNMFAYCNNSPVEYIDDCATIPTHSCMETDGGPRDPNLENLTAESKYNAETVKVMAVGEEEKNNVKKDDIYITYSFEKTNPAKNNIQIHNSYKTNDINEMYAIVNVMMNNSYYEQWIQAGGQTKSASDYVAQWQAHNMAYQYLPFPAARAHTADVDFGADESWIGDKFWRYIG